MITQNLFNKKSKTFMDYEPGKLPGKKDRGAQTKAEAKAYNPFASNVTLVGDNITQKDYDDFFEGFNDPYGEKREQERQQKKQLRQEPKIRKLPFAPSQEVKIEKMPVDPNKPLSFIQYVNGETEDPWVSSLGGDLKSNEDKDLFLEGFVGESKQLQNKTQNKDAIEFGADSETYKILQDLSKRWYATSDSAEKDRLHEVAEEVRRLARGNNRVKYGTDEIFDVMHKNAKLGQLVNAGSLGTIPIKATLTNPLLAGASGGILEPSAFLTAMTDYGPWDYKRKDYWRVGGDEGKNLKFFDGKDLDEDNNRNWLPWIYFDGYLIGADKFGNMNMAYVGKKMGLPEWVYKNFTTMDNPEDIFWIDKGISYANLGR